MFAQGVSSRIHTLIRPYCVYSECLPLLCVRVNVSVHTGPSAQARVCVFACVQVGGCVQQESDVQPKQMLISVSCLK